VELTAPVASGPRELTERDVRPEDRDHFGPHGPESRWAVTNPFLPASSHFLHAVSTIACVGDGTIYIGGDSVVPAAESGRPPRSNGDWYADNGRGVWRVDPRGRITGFAVRAYGNQPGWDRVTARCGVRVEEAALSPQDWGGMAVDARGDVFVTDSKLHLVLKFRRDGVVERVAGGGPDACRYDPWKTLQKGGYQDGPGKDALFMEPMGLTFDRDGNLLVADRRNCALRRIAPDGVVTTIHKGCVTDEGSRKDRGEQITFRWVVVDKEGLPVVGGSRTVMETYANVHRFHPDGRVERLLEGRKLNPKGGQQHVIWIAGLNILPGGAIVISDSDGGTQNDRMRELRAGRLSTLVGKGGQNDTKVDRDGPAAQAVLFAPGDWCASADGTMFVLPQKSWRPVRKIDPVTRSVSTWVY